MKKTEIQKIKERSITDLEKDLILAKEELRKTQFDLHSLKLKNFSIIGEIKKKIARILTFIKLKKNG